MKPAALIFAFSLIFLIPGIHAQKTTGATKFSSRYTNLVKDCRTLRGGDGQDDAFDCRGVGDYRIYVGSAAAAQVISIRTPDDQDIGDVPMQGFDWDQSRIKVEWRLADGKPFAVIMRFFKYGDEKAKEYDYFGKKIGEELRVVGLKGFENINFTVDANAPDANLKARALADEGYNLRLRK